MNTVLTASIITGCLCGAILLGIFVRRFLPEHHRDSETKDTVKIAVGLIATMSALLLGLLVSSAKESYDTLRGEVIQMGARVTFLDRIMGLYGSEAAPLRAQFHTAIGRTIQQMWAQDGALTSTDVQAGDALFTAIQSLSPQNDMQRALKGHAADLAVEIAQIRTLVRAQSLASISWPLLIVVVAWLVIIFFSFSLLAPSNTTAKLALIVSAISVAGAIFLIMEMDRPFTGLIRISSEPLANALTSASK